MSRPLIGVSGRIIGDNGILVLGDCGVIPDPTSEQLADIATMCVDRARRTVQILNPKVAMLSYSYA